jgi:hypothetical protein
MHIKTRFTSMRWLPGVLCLLLPFLLAACGRWILEPVPDPRETPMSRISIRTNLTFTAAVPEFGTPETGRQDINLGTVEQPGRYVLHLENDSPSNSGHWLEWDYLSLKAGDNFLWQIGQSETPPDLNYTGKVTDEFCSMAVPADCKTAFEVVSGKIDERSFPKTLNDGSVPAIAIGFRVPSEQTGTDLVLTLSTLYSSHVPDTKHFKMRVILEGPF